MRELALAMTLTKNQNRQMRSLVNTFLEENAKLNLSAFRTEEQCYIGNVLDSLAALDVSEASALFADGATVLDLGTGGGFPLLPLAALLPNVQCTGLDATQKKVDAVARIAVAEGLKNVALVAGRSEELAHDAAHREQYDIVLARGLAPLNVLLELAAPFAKVGGYIVCWKSVNIEKELEESLLARAEFSCHLEGKHRYDLGKDWGERQLLIFKKTFATKKEYPRSVGTPKKKPLL